ncbi:MAG: hypothetical protein ABJN72_07010 [Sulfitobacter sp.]
MPTPSFPLGIALQNGSGRKARQNRHIRTSRQRRKVFDKMQNALIVAAWKRWGDPDAMPADEREKLHKQIACLRQEYIGC